MYKPTVEKNCILISFILSDRGFLSTRAETPLLQGIGIETLTRSKAMSLDTLHYHHSMYFTKDVDQLTIIPILATPLLLPSPKPMSIALCICGDYSVGWTVYPMMSQMATQDYTIFAYRQ